jgi:hypothetical protein
VIGHSLPHVLRLVLEQVANGGFGPGYGLLGVFPTSIGSKWNNDPDWDRDQLVILDWGDAMFATVSLSSGVESNYSYWDKFL